MITREQFDRIDNCQDSLDYIATQPDLATAWDNCERGNWLLAFARKAKIISKEQAIRIAIGEAEAVLPIWTARYPNDKRPQQAIDATKAWLANPSEENAAAAAYAAYAARADAYAARADAYAAYAASAAVDAVYTADYAASAARATAYVSAYAYAANMASFRKAQCNRIRAIIPNPFKE